LPNGCCCRAEKGLPESGLSRGPTGACRGFRIVDSRRDEWYLSSSVGKAFVLRGQHCESSIEPESGPLRP